MKQLALLTALHWITSNSSSTTSTLWTTILCRRDDPARDQLGKIRPLIDAVNDHLSLIPLEELMSIDKQIIPFKSVSALEQHCPQKEA